MLPHLEIPRAAWGPLLLVSLLIVLALWRSGTTPPLIAPSSAVIDPGAERSILPGQPTPTIVPLAGDFAQRNDLIVVSAEGLYDNPTQAQLAADLEQALNYVAARFGARPAAPISAYVGWEASCNLHGIAYTDQHVTQAFTCPDLPPRRAVNILAHEFVHQLAHDRYGPSHLQADLILLEGVATWGAGEYWLGGQSSFGTFVRRQYKEAGALLPLATHYAGRPIGDMNKLYYQWASFVEFLIETYGRDHFDALYVSGSNAPGSADYTGVYGKDLSVLEQEWLVWLDRR